MSKFKRSRIGEAVATGLLMVCVLVPVAFGRQAAAETGKVTGTVIVRDSDGKVSSVPGVAVRLSGAVKSETETDAQGEFAFTSVPAGKYEIRASLPGFEAADTVVIEAGAAATIELELNAAAIKNSVTVTAKEERAEQPSPGGTVDENTLKNSPNVNERFESALPLIPGVVRGPDGRINLKGGRVTQSGALVNSANVTDPATGAPAINLPIDVVSSVQVISNPYDPQYGRFTGAVSTVDTKVSNYGKFHFSAQNLLPRIRDREGTITGIGAATPRFTFTGPIVKGRLAITQSIEYRYVRTPVNSLPALQRDTKLESFDSYTQVDAIISPKQTATFSVAVYPQKLDYFGLNTFTPQPSTPDFHQRGYQAYVQDRYLTAEQSILTSQLSYKRFDADVTAQSNELYRLLPDTTEGGFFSRQARRTSRIEWQETYQFAPVQLFGSHEFRIGFNYARSSYEGRQAFLPTVVADASNTALERITFSQPTQFAIDQNETGWYTSDQWSVIPRLILSLGARFDHDQVTNSTHVAPRAGFLVSLTKDSKTVLKGGAGIFYDRVPLMIPAFEKFPERTVTLVSPSGNELSSTFFQNRITEGLRNPRSTAWNLELDRKVTENLLLRVGYEQRNTAKDFIVSPLAEGNTGILSVSNSGSDSYKEFQVTGRYQFRGTILNASYVRSKAFGDLNDFNQFFGTFAQAVIQPNGRGRLPFDAPNRFLFWSEIAGPWKLTLIPVYDLHTGFPYSVEDEFREYVGPRNIRRFPRFSSLDLQMTRRVTFHLGHRRVRARAGFSVFNVFNHFNPRDVQNNLGSEQFGGFYNDAWREFRGKFVLEL